MSGHWEIIVIILLAILIFGPKKIPELMRGLGKGLREFKDSMKGVNHYEEDDVNENKKGKKDKPREEQKSDQTD